MVSSSSLTVLALEKYYAILEAFKNRTVAEWR